MQLTKGGNTVLGPIEGSAALGAVLVGVQWDSGSLECDLTAIVCDATRKALSDEHFLFWGHETAPDSDIYLLNGGEPHPRTGDRAQVAADLGRLAPEAARLVISLSTLTEGGDLSAVKSYTVRVLDLAGARELATFTVQESASIETCMILVEIYRHNASWKVRAVGQGYATGLAGLGKDHGVNIA
jgi:tellurium resistance protein TerD